MEQHALIEWPSLLWIPLLPLIGFLLNGLSVLFGRPFSEKASSSIAILAVLGSAILSAVAFFQLLGHHDPVTLHAEAWSWIVSGRLELPISFVVDRLSAIMIMIITWVGLLIHIYSAGYMHGDPGYARFFTYLNLFMVSMLVLVMGSSLPLLFIGWEGVGLCSYLLIGFWYEGLSNAQAGKKAFVVNRVGDFFFLLGMFVLFMGTIRLGDPTLEFRSLLGLAEGLAAVTFQTGLFGEVSLPMLAGLFLFLGACGKSAQIPLYIWLPDAMAGPTPVSALIHAATMVTAGVYLCARMFFLYDAAPVMLAVIATVGAATAFLAATMALVQNDIKKALAYSTISQLGFMFMGVGAGAYFAGVFHLMTHAFFKACLFLGSGSVMHAMSNETDMRIMGGLRRYMPHTHKTYLIATLAIAGIFPFAGFFSKDEILWKVLSSQELGTLGTVLYGVGLAAALCTAFYMGRTLFMTFWGESRTPEDLKHHVHESPASMTVPLWILAILSTVGGFVGLQPFIGHLIGVENWFAGFVGSVTGYVHEEGAHHDVGFEVTMASLALIVAIFGVAMSYVLYVVKRNIPMRLSEMFALPYKVLVNKYWVDEIYDALIVRPVGAVSRVLLWRVVDVNIVDGIVRATGRLSRFFGRVAARFENGFVNTYAVGMLLGAVIVLLYLFD